MESESGSQCESEAEAEGAAADAVDAEVELEAVMTLGLSRSSAELRRHAGRRLVSLRRLVAVLLAFLPLPPFARV